jgi:hypothetical protein
VTVAVQRSACENEQVRIAWQASDARARVAIKGIACDLPATGSMDVQITKETTFRVVASTCRIGPEVTAKVTVTPAPVITSFTADHQMLAAGSVTTVHFAYEHGSDWSIGGALPVDGDPLAGASTPDSGLHGRGAVGRFRRTARTRGRGPVAALAILAVRTVMVHGDR